MVWIPFLLGAATVMVGRQLLRPTAIGVVRAGLAARDEARSILDDAAAEPAPTRADRLARIEQSLATLRAELSSVSAQPAEAGAQRKARGSGE